MKINSKNEKVKSRFFIWMREAKGASEATIDAVESAILLYEDFTKHDDFAHFNQEKAKAFKEHLKNRRIPKPLALPTYSAYLRHLRKFLEWLTLQAGYKSRIKRDALDYLSLTDKENRAAGSPSRRNYPPLDYVKQICASIEPKNEIDLRDRALIAFTLLSGMRDMAISSLTMECFDEKNIIVTQDPKLGVKTKFGKWIQTCLVPFDTNVMAYFLEWHKLLQSKGFGAKDPLFPRSKANQGVSGLSFETSTEIEAIAWSDASPIRHIFKRRAEAIGLEYFSPHTFRHLHWHEASKNCRSGEELRAVSQNIGHEFTATSMAVYGSFSPDDLAERIKRLNFSAKPRIDNEELLSQIQIILANQRDKTL